MKIQNGLFALALFFLVIIGAFTHSGCANIIPPTGGPKDTLPPVLISATPVEFMTNFKGNKIVSSSSMNISMRRTSVRN